MNIKTISAVLLLLFTILVAGCTNIPPIPESKVSITVPKNIFASGETIEAVLQNNSETSVFYLSGCVLEPFSFYKKTNTGFEKVFTYNPNNPPPVCLAIPAKNEVKAGERATIQITLPQKVFSIQGTELSMDGTYKIALAYATTPGTNPGMLEEPKMEAQSSEFTIRFSQPPPQGNVNVQTNKTSYDAAETIELRLQNNSSQAIYFYGRAVQPCLGQVIGVMKKVGADYEEVSFIDPNGPRCTDVVGDTVTVQPGETATIQWENPRIFNESGQEQPVAGAYKIIVQYSFAGNSGILGPPIETVESNEFTMTQGNVRLQTSKTSYLPQETIEFSLTNNNAQPIYREPCPGFSVLKKNGNEFEQVSPFLACPAIAYPPGGGFQTILSGETKPFSWQNPQIIVEQQTQALTSGTYKIAIRIGTSKNENGLVLESFIIESNEFQIASAPAGTFSLEYRVGGGFGGFFETVRLVDGKILLEQTSLRDQNQDQNKSLALSENEWNEIVSFFSSKDILELKQSDLNDCTHIGTDCPIDGSYYWLTIQVGEKQTALNWYYLSPVPNPIDRIKQKLYQLREKIGNPNAFPWESFKLKTNKKQYMPGENILVELQNNSEKSVFIKDLLQGDILFPAVLEILRKENGKFRETSQELNLDPPTPNRISSEIWELKSGEKKTGNWNSQQTVPGIYKFRLQNKYAGYLQESPSGIRYTPARLAPPVYSILESNEFQIREAIPEPCNWTPGVCTALIQPGFAFDAASGECRYISGGSGCSNPPFTTLQQCQQTCEQN